MTSTYLLRLKNNAVVDPVANFCNVCAVLSAINATFTYMQLPYEAQSRHLVGYLILLATVLTIPVLTLYKKIDLICLITSTILNLTACYSLIFLGSNFIGYCLFFMSIVFNMFAFPKTRWKTRWGTLFFSLATLAFCDFLITKNLLPLNQLVIARSPLIIFSFDILAIGTVIVCVLFAQSILIEKNKKATAATLAKSRFIANTSHELRTPLSAIIGFIDLILDTNPDEKERHKYLEIVKRNGNQLLQIVNDVLDLSKIEADKLEIENQVFELFPLLDDLHTLMELKAHKKGLKFSIQYNNILPSQIYSDPLRLRQILVNLVGNAIKFTSEGEVKILIENIKVPGSDDIIQFDIIDTGPGIDTQHSQNLFEAFTQGPSYLSRKFGGSGLGLSVSRKLAELLGGKLELISSLTTKGCVFRLSLRCKTSEIPDFFLKNMPPTANLVPFPLEGKNILIVDDSVEHQTLVNQFLYHAGATVDIAENGQVALEMIETNHHYDAILMDVQMPVMNGHETLKTLRRKGYEIPIIALTADAIKKEQITSSASGFNAYLTKPLQRQALIAMLVKLTRS